MSATGSYTEVEPYFLARPSQLHSSRVRDYAVYTKTLAREILPTTQATVRQIRRNTHIRFCTTQITHLDNSSQIKRIPSLKIETYHELVVINFRITKRCWHVPSNRYAKLQTGPVTKNQPTEVLICYWETKLKTAHNAAQQ